MIKLKPFMRLPFLVVIFLLISFSGQAQIPDIRINEFMALNGAILTDQDGEYSDWIEIYNASGSPVSLLNWALTDDSTHMQKWKFPDVVLAPDSFIVVYASGKNRALAGLELHTDFSLSRRGEYLALLNTNGIVISGFAPLFPEQQSDYSFARADTNYFITSYPTPGSVNRVSGYEILPKPVFSHTLCFYESPIDVSISTPFPDAKIYYTIDGKDPGPENGILYTGPVPVSTTTVLRAVAVKSGNVNKNIATQTFLFLQDVVSQSANPEGYPTTWGPYVSISGIAPADYGMDPEVTTDPEYSGLIDDALLSLPSISLVADKNHFFSKNTDPGSGGIYIYTGAPTGSGIGKGWERPVSVEFFNQNGTREFQIDAGIQLHGGHSRLPEKSPKHSFRIVFKNQYGPSKLEYPLFGESVQESFNNFTLSAGFGNALYHHSYSERARWQFIQDVWAKDTQRDMGHSAGHSRYVHLYINGMYWGIYNTNERLDEDYAEAQFRGLGMDYDIIKDYAEVANGESAAWDAMMALASKGLASDTSYQQLLGNYADETDNPDYESFIDPVNMADYMILNFYGNNADWDHHNWVAIRNRVDPGTGFKFFSWDAERILEDPFLSTLDENNENRPSGLFQEMMKNPGFKKLFADRVQKHCFNGGTLTVEAARNRYVNRAEEIDLAVIAESARWGDYRRDVHRHSSGPYNILYTREHWLDAKDYILNNFFPQRTAVFIEQLQQKGWFPVIAAPEYQINGVSLYHDTDVKSGDFLSMTTTSAGQIYYTTRGMDPIGINGPDEDAFLYSGPFSLDHGIIIKARTFNGTNWSALSEFRFFQPDDLENLKLTEIHYKPLPQADTIGGYFEFVELKNTGTSPLDLSEVRLDAGVYYTFSANTILEPGKFIVLASSPDHFEARYSFKPFGQFEGAISNGGEEIRIISAEDTLLAVSYDDKAPWPLDADGNGYSLVPAELNPNGTQKSAFEWRSSFEIHGSPGKDDVASQTPVTSIVGDKSLKSHLEQNYPNPFHGSTSISYFIDKESVVQLDIYNIMGMKVSDIVKENQSRGRYFYTFNPAGLPPGVYFYRLLIDGELLDSKRMIFIKE